MTNRGHFPLLFGCCSALKVPRTDYLVTFAAQPAQSVASGGLGERENWVLLRNVVGWACRGRSWRARDGVVEGEVEWLTPRAPRKQYRARHDDAT